MEHCKVGYIVGGLMMQPCLKSNNNRKHIEHNWDQTAFVNVSIFDRNYIEALFGGLQYPDGTYVIDCVEELIEHQKLFMEVVSEIRSVNMFTFPVNVIAA